MYSTCIFCHNRLGSNEAIETFPIGRRLAFDSAKGRLWVVCTRCLRWNLSPIEERWEAVERCDELFRQTRRRASTDQIGLARLREGTELIRIGRPLRPEFAAWRYSRSFGRRRRRAAVGIAAGSVVWLGAIVGGAMVGGALLEGAVTGVLGPLAPFLYHAARGRLNRPARIRSNEGELITVAAPWLDFVQIRPLPKSKADWQLLVPYGATKSVSLTGEHARIAAALLLPRVNRSGARERDVAAAVDELESVGDPARYFVEAEQRARKLGWGYRAVAGMPAPIRLALEMAAQEENERRAMEGELRLLEQAWKDAEEVAAIADSLLAPTLPPHTDR